MPDDISSALIAHLFANGYLDDKLRPRQTRVGPTAFGAPQMPQYPARSSDLSSNFLPPEPGEQAPGLANLAQENPGLARRMTGEAAAEMTPIPSSIRAYHAVQEGRPSEAIGEMAPWVAGPIARKTIGAIRELPKAVTIPALAAGATVAGTSSAGQAQELPHARWFTPQGTLKIGPNSSADEIRSMQEFLKGLNLYNGPIDGKWKGGTAGAAGAYARQLGDSFKLEQEGKAADAAKAQATTAQQAATKREQDARSFADYSTQWRGEHPIKAWIAEHPWLTATVPGGLSLALGAITQPWAARKFYNADTRRLEAATRDVRSAGRADIDTGAGRGERATNLNALWTRGGANDVPFARSGRTWRHEPNAPGADTLYPEPGLGTRALREGYGLAVTGLPEGAAEYAFSGAGNIQEQLSQARADLDNGFTKERAEKVLDLEHQLNLAKAYQRGAVGAGVGSGLAAAKRTLLPQNLPTFRQYGAAERYRQELADKVARSRTRRQPPP